MGSRIPYISQTTRVFFIAHGKSSSDLGEKEESRELRMLVFRYDEARAICRKIMSIYMYMPESIGIMFSRHLPNLLIKPTAKAK